MSEWNEIVKKEAHSNALQQNKENQKKFSSSAADAKLAEIEQKIASFKA